MGHPSRKTWRRVGALVALGWAGIAAAAPPEPVSTPASSADMALSSGLVSTTAGLTAPPPGADALVTDAPTARKPLALQASLATLRARLRPEAGNALGNADRGAMLHRGLDVKVVELPREGAPIGPPPKRAHHALSIGMEGPKQMLRGLGLDATECAGRFRMPSKLGRKSDGSTQVDIAAQVGMACKF